MILSRPRLRPWHRGRFNRTLTANLAPSQQEDEEEHDSSDETRKVKAELSSLLRTCRQSFHGRLLHFRLLSDGLELKIPFPNLLVLMYTNCSAFDDAHACIALLPQALQNVFTWNILFKAVALQGLCHETFRLYNDMVAHGVLPNKVTFRSMLDACNSKPTSYVFQLHFLTVDCDLDTDAAIGTALANLYSRIGSLQDAAKVFDFILQKDVVSWTSMMLIYAQHGHTETAIHLFEQMQLEAIAPDRVTFICVAAACDKPLALPKGRQIHSAIMENGLEADVTVGTALVSMYGKCGSLRDAKTTFHQMAQPNVVTWNAIIGAVFQGETDKKAFYYFHQMLIEGAIPNRETYINFLGGCANLKGLFEGMLAHAQLLGSGTDLDLTLGNVLINMYGKCFSLKHARKVFEKMDCWDVVSWSAMINVYAQHGECLDAYLLFCNMHVKGVKPNEYTFVSIISALTNPTVSAKGRRLHWYVCAKGFDSNEGIKNALLNMYARFGSIEDAEWTFKRLLARDVISWTAMIAGFAEHGEGNKALSLFARMQQEGKQPNEISFVNIITACAALTGITEGRLVHGCTAEIGLDSHIEVANALINMYGKCGSLEDAQGLFVNMQERDRVSWNTLLTVFAQCGHGREAVALFDSMKDSHTTPDNVTFSIVLSSCSHSGLVAEAWQLFMSAEQDHGFLPANGHYVCIVDILGRAGQLSDGATLISLMPAQPSLLAFMTLIGACQYHLEVGVGECAARFLLELDPENSASYVVLSNLYALIGWE